VTRTTESNAIELRRPDKWTVPLVFSSPHSGRHYPESFIKASRLDPVSLRRSEDAFIDEIFQAAPDSGAPLLLAHYPRAYIDPNREAYELDPEMFSGPLPDYVNVSTPRIAAGLGTIARVVTNGEEIYRNKLDFKVAKQAIEECYFPYHQALESLLEEAVDRFGGCLLIDCHSMPSIGGPMDRDPGFRRVDFVLGDRHGTSCAPFITEHAETTLRAFDYVTTRNTPYAGGFTTHHYGRPEKGWHALQIEVNRHLYMNELKIERGQGFQDLQENMTRLIHSFTDIDPVKLARK